MSKMLAGGTVLLTLISIAYVAAGISYLWLITPSADANTEAFVGQMDHFVRVLIWLTWAGIFQCALLFFLNQKIRQPALWWIPFIFPLISLGAFYVFAQVALQP